MKRLETNKQAWKLKTFECVTDVTVFSWTAVVMAGYTQQVVDRTRMLNMQEDAYCHRISAEVMRRCLYKPAAPCRRRILSRAHDARRQARVLQSLPVTPGQSNATTPVISPTTSFSCFTVFSCGTTPRATSPETQDIDNQGLANLLTPRPRYVHASCSHLSNNEPSSPDSVFLAVPGISGQFYSRKGLSASIHCVYQWLSFFCVYRSISLLLL